MSVPAKQTAVIIILPEEEFINPLTEDQTGRWSDYQNTVSIGRIIVDPFNPLKSICCCSRFHISVRIWQRVTSDNGGTNWTKILFISDSTGAVDIAVDPVNSNNVYAAMWQRTRYPNGGQLYGSTSGIYKSTNGTNWTTLGQQTVFEFKHDECRQDSVLAFQNQILIFFYFDFQTEPYLPDFLN